jgi:hypothetical protein
MRYQSRLAAVRATALAAALALTTAFAATPTVAAAQSAVTISLTVAGRTYDASGTGECRSEPLASIYGVRAALWGVRYDGGAGKSALRNLSLTVWHPLSSAGESGGDMISFAAQVGSTAHRIDTVARPGKGGTVGSATISIRQQGPGARFEFSGRDANGAAIRGTVSCPRFSRVEAVAG